MDLQTSKAPRVAVRRAGDRGSSRLPWLDSRHTFSFADYFDPASMGFRALRVINDDQVAPGRGFGAHPHRDMEIITYVVSGRLAHRDSMGNAGEIRAGDVQRMSAGTGVVHSEMNPSPEEPVRLLQIWILPAEGGLTPSYAQRPFPPHDRKGRLALLVSPDGAEGSLSLHQDARLYGAALDSGEEVHHELAEGRGAWLQVVRGEVEALGHRLAEGDGLAVTGAPGLLIQAHTEAELLLFDLA